MVQFLAKWVKRFKIYCQIKYLSFDSDFWFWSEGHKILFFLLTFYGDYMVQYLAKSVKLFIKNGNIWTLILTFDPRMKVIKLFF